MTNTIIDWFRIPTDEYGGFLFDMEEIRDMINEYKKHFPEHDIIALPADLKVWEDVDIDSLRYIRGQINKMIEKKEQEKNAL